MWGALNAQTEITRQKFLIRHIVNPVHPIHTQRVQAVWNVKHVQSIHYAHKTVFREMHVTVWMVTTKIPLSLRLNVTCVRWGLTVQVNRETFVLDTEHPWRGLRL